MRSRGQSPLLPYTNAQRLPQKQRTRGGTAAVRFGVIATVTVCLIYGLYSVAGRFGAAVSSTAGESTGGSGRGLAAHEEVAQLQGKNVPVLEGQAENAQLQTQGTGHEKPPDKDIVKGLAADHAAKAIDSVEQVHSSVTAEPFGLYTMAADDIDGKSVQLSDFAGKISLVVNVASECGYTDSNYKGLQQLYEQYESSGFEVLAFPCNSFGQQEPGTAQAIKDFARVRYGITFPLFQKVEVLGPDAHPIFNFLRANLPASEGGGAAELIKWNFSKWLVNKQGIPVKHYDSAFDSEQLERDIAAELLKAM